MIKVQKNEDIEKMEKLAEKEFFEAIKDMVQFYDWQRRSLAVKRGLESKKQRMNSECEDE